MSIKVAKWSLKISVESQLFLLKSLFAHKITGTKRAPSSLNDPSVFTFCWSLQTSSQNWFTSGISLRLSLNLLFFTPAFNFRSNASMVCWVHNNNRLLVMTHIKASAQYPITSTAHPVYQRRDAACYSSEAWHKGLLINGLSCCRCCCCNQSICRINPQM